MTTELARVDRLRRLPRPMRAAIYRHLPPGALACLRYRADWWARPEQALPPLDLDWTIDVSAGGRGSGKTWRAGQVFNREIESGRARRPRIIAASDAALEATVINGPSGLRTWLPPHRRPTFTSSGGFAGVLTYPNGTRVMCCSAQRPGQAIGLGTDLDFYDDPAGWVEACGANVAEQTWKQARTSNREGYGRALVATTRRGVHFIRRLLSGDMRGVVVHKLGSVLANASNLAPGYVRETLKELEGNDWAAEELNDEQRDEAMGSLWKRKWIDDHRVAQAPELERVIVSVDPADDDKINNDETGIVVLGLGYDARVYVLADFTGHHSADIWPAIVAYAFATYQADAVVCETNRGASLVRRCMAIELPHVRLEEVQATRGKATRAEPGAQLYRDGRVSHLVDGPQLSKPGWCKITVQVFEPRAGRRMPRDLAFRRDPRRWVTLEDELTGWVRTASLSPNGIDALTWGLQSLCPADGGAPWAPIPEVAPEPKADTFDPYRYMATGAGPDPLRYMP